MLINNANAMYNTEQRMQEIMEPPQLSAVEKSKLYSDQMNRFLTFKNKMDVPPHQPTHHKCLPRRKFDELFMKNS
jgi:hypothetical protein